MTNNEKLFNFLILLPYLWLASGLLAYKSGDKGMLVMILISIIATLVQRGFSSAKINLIDNKILYVLFLVSAYAIFCYFYHGISNQEVSSLFASALLFTVFPRELLTEKLLCVLTIVGALVCFIYTIYYAIYLGASRTQWSINAIPYATLTAAFGLLAFVQLINQQNNSAKLIAMLILALSITTLLINQTRGVFLAFFITILLLLLLLYKGQKINWKATIISCVLLLMIGFGMRSHIETRITQTQAEIANIVQGNLNTSIGLRMQMWQISPKMIENSYLLGLGRGHAQRLDNLYKEGHIPQSLYQFYPRNYHNQYIDQAIKHGFIGLALLLLLLSYPLFQLNGLTAVQKNSVIAITSLVALSSIMDVTLHHGQTILMYCLLVYGLTSTKNTKESHCHENTHS